MINRVYEETTENLRNRIDVRLVNNAKDYTKYTSKPRFVSRKSLAKILLPFMKLSQLERLISQSM